MEMLKELLEKEFVTAEELETIEESNEVVRVENNGSSGLHVGYNWLTVALENGEEYDIYL